MPRTITFFIFYFFHLFVFAQKQDSTQDKLLWQVSGNGMPAPSYLYGTMHIMCKDDVSISETAKLKLASCKQIYFEIDFKDKKDTSSNLHGTTLEKLIGKRHFKALKDLFVNSKMADSTLNKLKPFVAEQLMYYQILGCPTISIEQVLLKIANTDNIPVYGLETSAQHILPIDNIQLWKQADILDDYLDNLDKITASLKKEIILYNEGEIVTLYSKSAYTPYGDKTENTVNMLEKRNELWIPIMEKAFMQKSTFFAFGYAHLIDEKGIISLLIKKGYTITEMHY